MPMVKKTCTERFFETQYSYNFRFQISTVYSGSRVHQITFIPVVRSKIENENFSWKPIHWEYAGVVEAMECWGFLYGVLSTALKFYAAPLRHFVHSEYGGHPLSKRRSTIIHYYGLQSSML